MVFFLLFYRPQSPIQLLRRIDRHTDTWCSTHVNRKGQNEMFCYRYNSDSLFMAQFIIYDRRIGGGEMKLNESGRESR